MAVAAAGALGGASGELGSAHRASTAAFLVVHGLLGREVEGLFPQASAGTPVRVRMETDDATDDVLCETSTGRRAWIQAKHQVRVGDSGVGLAPVVEQWAASIRDGSVAPGDALVLAVANLTRPLRHLREALRRRRDANSGNLTGAQQTELARLEGQVRAIAPDFAQAVVNRMLDAAVVWYVDAADAENTVHGAPVDSPDAQLGAAMLGAVYAPAHCPRAMAALTTAARSFAQLRSGAVTKEWLAVLRRAHIPMSEHPADVPATQQLARDAALESYRIWLTSQAARLSLSNLGYSIPRMPSAGLADGIRVTDAALLAGAHADAEPTTSRLLPVVRRYRRLLLRGLPGSGKSVALAQLAAQCVATEHAPTPVLVRLQDLQQPVARGAEVTSELLARIAAETCPEVDRRRLEEALAERMRTGDAVVLLDGLDECRSRRHVVAQALHSWLSTTHQEMDLVLSTRDSAYSSASILKLREFALCEPDDLDLTLGRLLEHLAATLDEPERQDDWIGERRRWLAQARADGEDFWRVPLFAVMMVLSAARHEPSMLPTNRASILYQAIEDVTRHWEVRFRDVFASAALTGQLAEDVLIDTFAVLGRALSDEGELPAAEAKALVAERLVKHFGRPRGVAESQAASILDEWDEAGVFVHSHGEKVSARTRLFTEVAMAIWLRSRSEPEQRAWIVDHLEDATWHQTLELAAELSPTISAELAAIAPSSASPIAGRVLMRARGAGAAVTVEAMWPVWQQLIACVPALRDPAERWALVRELATEPLPSALHKSALDTLAQAAPERTAIMKALAAYWWDFTGGDASWRHESFVSMLATDNPPSLGATETEASRFDIDTDFAQAMVEAATALIPEFPEYADQVGKVAGAVSSDASWQLQRLLVDEGFENSLPDWIKQSRARDTRMFSDAWMNDSFWSPWFDALAAEEAPGDITPRQAWHLDELAAVVAVMKIGASPWNVVQEATDACPAALARLTVIVAKCIGVEPAVVSAQAQLLSPLRRMDVGELLLRNPTPKAAVPKAKAACVAEHTTALVEVLDQGTAWLQNQAAALLSHLPEGPEREPLFDALETELGQRVPRAQFLLARMMLITDETLSVPARLTRLASHELAGVRAGATASAVASAYSADRIEGDADHIYALAGDPDAQVRSTLVEALTAYFAGRHSTEAAVSGAIPIDINTLVAAVLGPVCRWACATCGSANAAADSFCAACGDAAPKLVEECEKLIELVRKRDHSFNPA
jgi:hypothetical protein